MKLLPASPLLLLLVACSGPMITPDAGPRPMLSGLPDCGTAPADAGTVADFFDAVVVNNGCAAGGCHGPGMPFFNFQFADAGEFRVAMVNADSLQAEMKRVTPRDVNQSYVIYKLWGQHLDAGVAGLGDRMPQGGPYLSSDQLCVLIEWINAGAP